MIVDMAKGFIYSAVGVVVGSAIVLYAVSTWTSLSTHWINSGLVIPLLGLHLAFSQSTGELRGRVRVGMMLIAAVMCTLGNYLAFVITSRTWFAEKIAPEHQGLFYQLTHPDVLPKFIERGSSGSGSEQTWQMYVCLGLILGPLIFWYGTRRS